MERCSLVGAVVAHAFPLTFSLSCLTGKSMHPPLNCSSKLFEKRVVISKLWNLFVHCLIQNRRIVVLAGVIVVTAGVGGS